MSKTSQKTMIASTYTVEFRMWLFLRDDDHEFAQAMSVLFHATCNY